MSSSSRVLRHWSRPLPVVAILLLPGVGMAATKTVQVGPGGSFAFSPDPVNIRVGDTVEWVWMSGPHTTTRTRAPETWDSGVASPPHMFSHTFAEAGRFPYVCTIHQEFGMTGTVVVEGAAGMTTTTTMSTGRTTSTTTLGPLASCQGISACAADLMAALPTAGVATNGKERRTVRRLDRLAGRAVRQLEAASTGGTRGKRLAKKAQHTLERLRTAVATAVAKGTLGVPADPIDAAINSLLVLDQTI